MLFSLVWSFHFDKGIYLPNGGNIVWDKRFDFSFHFQVEGFESANIFKEFFHFARNVEISIFLRIVSSRNVLHFIFIIIISVLHLLLLMSLLFWLPTHFLLGILGVFV